MKISHRVFSLLSLTLAVALFAPVAAPAAPPAATSPVPAASDGIAAAPAPAADAALAVPDLQQALGLSPLAGALAAASPSCCVSLRQQCAARCKTKGGVNEFTCFPESCTASCFCNVFP